MSRLWNQFMKLDGVDAACVLSDGLFRATQMPGCCLVLSRVPPLEHHHRLQSVQWQT